MNNVMHLAIQSDLLQVLRCSTGDHYPAPLCMTGDAHATMTYVTINVTCPKCKAAEEERKVYLLERFLYPEQRRLLARCFTDWQFYPWTFEEWSPSMLITRRRDGGEEVFIRKVDGLPPEGMKTRKGLTVHNGYVWVEWFRHGKCIGCKLIGTGDYWTVK